MTVQIRQGQYTDDSTMLVAECSILRRTRRPVCFQPGRLPPINTQIRHADGVVGKAKRKENRKGKEGKQDTKDKITRPISAYYTAATMRFSRGSYSLNAPVSFSAVASRR